MSLPDVARPPAAPARLLRTAGVLGLGVALPLLDVDNDAITRDLPVDGAWIERRTGIRARRHLAPGERLSDLAAEAARAALADAGLSAVELDLVLAPSSSQDELLPNLAPLVAAEIGAVHAGAVDVGAACTGFVAALALGAAWIEAGRARTVLVVGADGLSRFTDRGDRQTAALFGDGAGAVVLTDRAAGSVGPAVLGADGARGDILSMRRDDPYIRMDGHETFKQAVRRLGEASERAAAAAGLALDDLDLLVFHQANRRILTALVDRLGLDPARVVDAIADVGNTSAASIPLALEDARADGRLRPGDRVLLGAVGAGFTWGATVVTWGSA